MSQPESPLLIMTQTQSATTVISLDSPVYEPLWDKLMTQVVQDAFLGREVSFLTFQPPVWDLNLAELTGRVASLRYGKENFALVFAPSADPHILQVAAESTDFKLGVLLITSIPETPSERIENFVATLGQRKSPVEAIDTTEEYMECFDGKWLTWHNAQVEDVARCEQALRTFTARYSWQFEIHSA